MRVEDVVRVAPKTSASESIAACGIELFPHERLAFVKGRPVDLTAREFDILACLASHPGWVYSPEQLADGDEKETDHSPDSVRVHIAHLRRKLALADADGIVRTVRGAGYRLQGGIAAEVGDTDTDANVLETGPIVVGDGARVCSRRIRDSFWMLEEAVVELEQTRGGREVVERACDALDHARHVICGLLSERTP
jgi:DNA-binding winged helix-turn-helix (wHTH) protein